MTTIAAALRSKAISDITVPRIGALGVVVIDNRRPGGGADCCGGLNIFCPVEATGST